MRQLQCIQNHHQRQQLQLQLQQHQHHQQQQENNRLNGIGFVRSAPTPIDSRYKNNQNSNNNNNSNNSNNSSSGGNNDNVVLIQQQQDLNFPPMTVSSSYSHVMQPLSTLSESANENSYFDEFLRNSDLTNDLASLESEFDFGLGTSSMDSTTIIEPQQQPTAGFGAATTAAPLGLQQQQSVQGQAPMIQTQQNSSAVSMGLF